jgi:hypothetical protein
LAGFEVHYVAASGSVGADGATGERLGGLVGFLEERKSDAEAAVGGLGSGDGLEEEVDRGALLEGGHLGGDVGEYAALNGDLEALAEGIDHAQEARGDGDVVACGIDADDRVAGAEEQAVENGSRNAGG